MLIYTVENPALAGFFCTLNATMVLVKRINPAIFEKYASLLYFWNNAAPLWFFDETLSHQKAKNRR